MSHEAPASMVVVLRLTEQGYGDEPGRIPRHFKAHIEGFKHRKGSSQWRCSRHAFVPFTTAGAIFKDPGTGGLKDGLVAPGAGTPLYLFMHFRGARLVATAVVQRPSARAKHVKLVYLCAAPAARGAGLRLLRETMKRQHYLPDRPEYVKLDDDSGRPGYYSRAGFTRLPKSVQLGTRQNPKKVPGYKARLASPERDGYSYDEAVERRAPSVPSAEARRRAPPRRAPRRASVRSPYMLRRRYALRPRRGA